MIDKARETALKILYKLDKENGYSNIVLNEVIGKNKKNLNDKDIGLISEIVYGTTTWRLTIDEIIKKYSKIKLNKISVWILNILRIGIYQIIFLDKIPKSAAVNEGVNLAKRYGHKSSANFVNAILRKVEKKDYEEFSDIKNDIERISKQYSMPTWIIEELLQEMYIFKVEEICKYSNVKPKINIRINKLKTNKQELEENLKNENIKYTEGKINDFLVIEKMKNIENMDLFQKGYFTVQDEMAGLISIVLDPKEGENILDCCSAPGGKTTYIAELIKNNGVIDAWDIHEHRVKLVKENANRLGITCINTKVQDATIYNEEYENKYDKILLDVPCLGLGVLKRKPDIKWKRKKEDVEEINKLQMQILNTCSKYLKKGGELIYSTCSILKKENEDIIQMFIENNPNFEIVDLNEKYGKYTENSEEKSKYIKLFQNNENDGFFISKLIKK